MAAKVDNLRLVPFAVFYVACSVAGLMLIKTAGETGLLLAGIRVNWKILLGLLIYFAGFCTYLFLIQRYQLSYVFPFVVGLNYVFVVLAAWLFLKERISVTQWLGIAAILAGIVLMNLKSGGK